MPTRLTSTGASYGVRTQEGELRLLVRLSHRPVSWHYQLVRSSTGQPDLVHWLPPHRLLENADFCPDGADFQRQLQQALPAL